MSGPPLTYSNPSVAGMHTVRGRGQRLLPGVGAQILPHSRDAEKGVLGSMLQEPSRAIPEARQRLSSDCFSMLQHQVIFDALISMFENEALPDLITFSQYLEDVGQLAQVGGRPYVTELFAFVPTAANIGYYIDIVRDKYIARRIFEASNESALEACGDTSDIIELVANHEKRMEAVRLISQVGHMGLPQLTDISKFLGDNQPEEPPELVRGISHQGSKMLVGGTSKCRKTMTLIDLAVSVAADAPWWGFACKQGPVCYVNFEIQEAFFAKRVHDVCTAKGVTLERGMFEVLNLRGHCCGIENIIDDLLAVLRHRTFVLIIIDPIYKALGDRDENKAGDVASMLNELEKIAVKTGAAVAFGAHYSKGNQSRKEPIDRIGGSGVFARDPDSILTMTAHEEQEAFVVEATLRNFAPIEPFVVRWEWPLFTRADDLDPQRLKRPRTAKSGQFEEKYSSELLFNLLSFDQGLKPRDAVSRLKDSENISRDTVYRMRKKLMKQNLLVEREGLWFRGNGKGDE